MEILMSILYWFNLSLPDITWKYGSVIPITNISWVGIQPTYQLSWALTKCGHVLVPTVLARYLPIYLHMMTKFNFGGNLDFLQKNDFNIVWTLGGGSTGKMWCYEHFEMERGPDIVTFAKKMFSGGIYHNKEHRPKQAARIMNTWVGDPHKILLLREVGGFQITHIYIYNQIVVNSFSLI